MKLILPVPTVTLGPQWAVQINGALELIDSHDHTDGKGKRITPSAININQDFNINSKNLNLVRSLRLVNQPSALVGPSDIRSVYVINGDLFYNNTAGTSVQITDGVNLAAVPSGASTAYGRVSTAGPVFSITAPDTFSFVGVNSTGGVVTVGLPSASSVPSGRFYFIKDALGQSAINNITVDATGADLIDGLGAIILDQPFSAIQVVSNGLDRWDVYNVAIEDNSITTSKILNQAITLPKIEPGLDGQVLSTQNGSVTWIDFTAAEQYLSLIATSNWVQRTSDASKSFTDITFGGGLFVAVSLDGTNRVSTSTNGIVWTGRSASQANPWQSIAYGNDVYVAVASSGTNRVMSSSNAISWTNRTAAGNDAWRSIVFGDSLFVAVGDMGAIQTSSDGISWAIRTAPNSNNYTSITYGNGLYVAVSSNGTNRVITSSDGINWTERAGLAANSYTSITFGNGLFVAVSSDGINRIYTSNNGTTWDPNSILINSDWQDVTYGNGIYVMVGSTGDSRVAISSTGLTWTNIYNTPLQDWKSVVFGNSVFVSVGQTGGTSNIMNSLNLGL